MASALAVNYTTIHRKAHRIDESAKNSVASSQNSTTNLISNLQRDSDDQKSTRLESGTAVVVCKFY